MCVTKRRVFLVLITTPQDSIWVRAAGDWLHMVHTALDDADRRGTAALNHYIER